MYFPAKTHSLVAAIAQAVLASALPLDGEPATQCSNPRIRKEW